MYVCTKDGRSLKVVRNGVYIEEMLSEGEPYKLWSSDVLSCPECGFTLAVTAPEPRAEHYQRDYQDIVARVHAGQLEREWGRFIQ